MYKERIKKIREIISQKENPAILLTTPENRYYTTGFTGSDGYVLITMDKVLLIVDGRYTVAAKEETDAEVIEFSKNPFLEINSQVVKNLMVEEKSIPLYTYRLLKESVSGINFHNGSDVLEEVRAKKEKSECEKIKKASEITDAAFSYILDFLKTGVTEKEIAFRLEYFMREKGASGNSFSPIVAFGERGVLPHAEPTDRKLKPNEAVLMDYGCVFKGYCSDMTRTVFFGKADEEFKRIYNLVKKAQEKALAGIKSGVLASAADAFARDEFEKENMGKYFVHSLGHGVGLEIHEAPNLSHRSKAVLSENNVVTVEPGLYIPGKFGVRIEDTVLVTENGVEIFNKSEKNLIEL